MQSEFPELQAFVFCSLLRSLVAHLREAERRVRTYNMLKVPFETRMFQMNVRVSLNIARLSETRNSSSNFQASLVP